ncbi:MAG: sulfotransferase [Acidobacteria bacterium]|nr:MAG: sulfotransferase [Acidobacteriota bacterium]REK08903.1 MAG: sulfotransferase [Acidobacteriota bacterium]
MAESPLNPSSRARQPVLVIGMHRSGTSMVARLLEEFGVAMGGVGQPNWEDPQFKRANQALLARSGADWARPRAFLEALAIVDGDNAEAGDEMLAVAQRCVEAIDPRRQCGPWGWKDPRNTLTLPVWLRLFPAARVVHVVRNGFDVALSLQRRERRYWVRRRDERPTFLTLRGCFELWRLYLELGLGAESSSRRSLRVRYEDLARADDETVEKLAAFVGAERRPVELPVRRPRRRSAWDRRRIARLARSADDRILVELGYGLAAERPGSGDTTVHGASSYEADV